LCPTSFFDARFWMLLFRIDEDLARETREGPCPFCGEVLHGAAWRRKPRGADLPEEQSLRFSFCCSGDRCRRRVTPPSLRFLGRKVFVGVMVILVTALRQGPTPSGLRKLEGLLGISRRTIARWQTWWEEIFPASGFWKELKDRLSRSRALPERARQFIDRLRGHPSAHSLVRLLRSLALVAAGPYMSLGTEDR
jgi:hypothetical protein